MKETAVKLVCNARFRTPPVDRKFTYPFLAAINLMVDCASALSSFPSEPLDSHLPERLCLLRTELLFLSTTCVPSGRHVLHQRPQVKSVGIVPYYRSTRLFAPYLGDVFFMVAVTYDGRTTNGIAFDELVQIAVRLVEDSEGVRRKFVEVIEQWQSRDAYDIFEHIDVLLFVEGELFVDGFEKRYKVAVVISHEKVTHRLHTIVTPHCLTESVVIVGYTFVLESTVGSVLGEVEYDPSISGYRMGGDLSYTRSRTPSNTCS